jgi:single-strand DNA-binding protein
MPNLNKVMLMGNLTRDPEIKYTPKGTAVADIGLAVNRVWSTETGEKREEVTFVDVELWGRQAELAGEYLKKGRPVYIEGRLKLDTWDDKQSGQKRSKMRVVCENMQFLGSREGGGGPAGGGGGGGGEYSDEIDQGGGTRPPASAGAGGGGGAPRRPPVHQPPPRKPVDPDLDAADGDDIPF